MTGGSGQSGIRDGRSRCRWRTRLTATTSGGKVMTRKGPRVNACGPAASDRQAEDI